MSTEGGTAEDEDLSSDVAWHCDFLKGCAGQGSCSYSVVVDGFFGHWGVDPAWVDGVDSCLWGDPDDFVLERWNQTVHEGGFGGGVIAVIVFTELACSATDEADGSSMLQIGGRRFEGGEIGSNQEEAAIQVDGVGVTPLIQSHIGQRDGSDGPNSMVHNQDLNRTSLSLGSFGEEASNIRLRSDIGLKSDSILQVDELSRSGVIVSGDLGACSNKGLGRFEADSYASKTKE